MTQPVHPDVLILSDDTAVVRLFLEVLAERGVRGVVVADAATAADRLAERPWDLLVLDGAEAGPAEDLLGPACRRWPEMPVVRLAGAPSVAGAVRAMRAGCAEYLAKPIARAMVAALVEAAFPAEAAPPAAADEADGRCLYQIAGRSPRLQETIALAQKVATTSIPVLLTGESGTGKELLAYLIHRASRRSRGPYIHVNCAALSESLLESELFGHERGAFTGAVAQRKGRFERADGGTLLLDEISETGPRLQAELLRVLEQQDIERVGGAESIPVNVRILSTTNRDLEAEVARGAFRADLYWRLCGVRVGLPPLRERPEDLPVLVWHFVRQFAREVRRTIRQLDPEMMDLFRRHPWPGNVRQLRNVVRTALVVGEGPVLSLAGAPWLQAELRAAPPASAGEPSLRLRDLERQAILEAMRLTRSHQAKAARLLGITDRTLREKLRRYRQEGVRLGPPAPADPPAEAPGDPLEPVGTGDPACLKVPN